MIDGASAARRAAVRLTAARLVTVAAGLIGLVALARLLDPEDFGDYAMALAIYAVARSVVSGGFLQDAIRRPEAMPAATLALAAAVSLGLSLAVAALAFGIGALLPAGMRPDGPMAMLAPMLATLPLVALTLQREARLHRAIAFDVPALADIAGIVAEVATAIAFAWSGAGAVSLAWGFVAGALARSAVLMLASRGSRPVRPGLAELRPLAAFGLRMTSVDLMPKLADLAVIAALTGLAGPAATGAYSRASRLNRILDDGLLEGLRPMMLPVISAALRAGHSPASVIARKHDLLMPLAFAGFGGIALLAEPLVGVLLGPGWEAAIAPTRILALAGLAMPIQKMSQKVFLAMGRLEDFSRIQTVALALRVALGAAGALVSLEAFCIGLVAATGVKAALVLRWEARHADAPLPGLIGPTARALAVAVPALSLPAALVWATALPGSAILALSVAWALPVWLLALRLTAHPLAEEIGTVAARVPLLRGLRTGR